MQADQIKVEEVRKKRSSTGLGVRAIQEDTAAVRPNLLSVYKDETITSPLHPVHQNTLICHTRVHQQVVFASSLPVVCLQAVFSL